MDWKKLALSGVVAGSLLGFGCDSGYLFPARDNVCAAGATPPCATDTPATADDVRTVSLPADLAGETRTYAMAVISIPEADGGRAAGFNLDGLNSGEGSGADDANCEEFNEDYVSLFDSNHVGVDNALQGLVSTIESLLPTDSCPGGNRMGCLDATLQEQINEGSLILMMEVSGIDSFTFDDSISISLYLGDTGGTPPEIDGSGALAPGQTFTAMAIDGVQNIPGDIFQGRVAVQASQLVIPIDAGDFMLDLVVENPQIRFTIGDTALTNGAIGGVLEVQAIVGAASAIAPGMESTVLGIVQNVADVTPCDGVDCPESYNEDGTIAATFNDNPMICASISVGLTFDAVSATRN